MLTDKVEMIDPKDIPIDFFRFDKNIDDEAGAFGYLADDMYRETKLDEQKIFDHGFSWPTPDSREICGIKSDTKFGLLYTFYAAQ